VGDGVADEASAINAAITAATAAGLTGPAELFFPTGTYTLGSTITLPNGRNIKFSGPVAGFAADEGAVIRGNLATLITKTGTTNASVIFQDLTFLNDSATGKCISLTYLEAPSGFYRCSFQGFQGISLPNETFNTVIDSCQFRLAGATFANSLAIQVKNHSSIRGVDIAGYYEGIRAAGLGVVLVGGRVERCFRGVVFGLDDAGVIYASEKSVLEGFNFEACDTAVVLHEASGVTIQNSGGFGHANNGCPGSTGLPSGSGTQEQEVVKITHSVEDIVLMGVGGGGTFANGMLNTAAAGGSLARITLISCRGPWGSLAVDPSLVLINTDTTNIIRAPVIATGSLPTGATAQNGRLVIEDNGAGDRNLIIYAGGQRFRIDGGAAI